MKDKLYVLGDLWKVKIAKELLKSVKTLSGRYVYFLEGCHSFIPTILKKVLDLDFDWWLILV